MKRIFTMIFIVVSALLSSGCGKGGGVNPAQAGQMSKALMGVASAVQSVSGKQAGETQAPVGQPGIMAPAPQPAQMPITPNQGMIPNPTTQPENIDQNLFNDASIADDQLFEQPLNSSTESVHQVPREIQYTSRDCAAASINSVMAYHGKNFSQDFVNQKVSDHISGRTDYMVQFARNQGFQNSSHISRTMDGDSLRALEQRVLQRPQVVRVGPTFSDTIQYRYPQSLNPQKNWGGDYTRSSQNGHFMVLKGFDEKGNPMLMDPANQDLGHVVADREWFNQNWTDTIDIV